MKKNGPLPCLLLFSNGRTVFFGSFGLLGPGLPAQVIFCLRGEGSPPMPLFLQNSIFPPRVPSPHPLVFPPVLLFSCGTIGFFQPTMVERSSPSSASLFTPFSSRCSVLSPSLAKLFFIEELPFVLVIRLLRDAALSVRDPLFFFSLPENGRFLCLFLFLTLWAAPFRSKAYSVRLPLSPQYQRLPPLLFFFHPMFRFSTEPVFLP